MRYGSFTAKRLQGSAQGFNLVSTLGTGPTNGSPFASVQTLHGLNRLSAWWVALGIDLERGRAGCPQDNAAHERFHRDVSIELEGLGEETQEGLDLWRQEFNYQRPHEALQMRCPGEVYQNSTRSFEGTPQELIYPGMAARQVDKNGSMSWQDQKLFLSRSLAGWTVGLKNSGGQFIEVWFTRLLLGHLDQSYKDRSWASQTPGRNVRLIHNRLFPNRCAAAT
jgi:putative transposase